MRLLILDIGCYHVLIMSIQQKLEETIAQLMQVNATMLAESTAMRSELLVFSTNYQTLVEATRVLTADRDTLQLRAIELEAANKRLTDMLWGRRCERRADFGGSPLLDFNADDKKFLEGDSEPLSVDVIIAQQTAQRAFDEARFQEMEARRKARQQRKGKSEAFPPHLERRVRILDLPEFRKEGLQLLGTKISERLRFEKPTIYVEQIHRHEYVRVGAPELGVQSAPCLPSIVEGCKYDFSVIAAVVAMKFGFHNPTYRLEDFFGQSGWRPSRSTMNDLVNYAVNCVDPLFSQAWYSLQQQPILLGDDTTLTVLLREELTSEEQKVLDDRSKNSEKAFEARLHERRSQNKTTSSQGSATSYAWLYTGLDAPYELRSQDRVHPPPDESPPDFSDPKWQYAPYNVFHWSLTHQNSVIDSHLANYRGTFVGDAAGVNARLSARSHGAIAHQACNSHARREFVKAESNDAVSSSQMLSFFRQLYAVEYRGSEMSSTERLDLRRREAVPIWQQMEAWLHRKEVMQALPKSAIGQAIGYLKNQWSALQLYLTDGEIPIDNNQSERFIRALTIGRKNWSFLGSAESAPGRMKLFSIVSSAQRHCLSIQDYLEDVLLRLSQAAQHRPKDLEIGSPLLMSLLPDRWGALHPQHVHRDRIDERKQTAESKAYYRLAASLAGNHPYAASSANSI